MANAVVDINNIVNGVLDGLLKEICRQNELIVNLTRKYDALDADCKELLSAVYTIHQGHKPYMVEFNERNGYPSAVMKLILDITDKTDKK